MAFQTPKGWEKESDALYIHQTGVRIQKRTYREKEGWFLIPVDLDQEVLPFDPTPEGRDAAFAAFAEGKLKTKKKPKAAPVEEGPPKPKRGRKPKERPEPEPEGEGEPGEEPAAAKDDDAEDDEKEEKEEKEEEDDDD